MDSDEGDDATIEYDIEIVESSSSTSLASNSIADIHLLSTNDANIHDNNEKDNNADKESTSCKPSTEEPIDAVLTSQEVRNEDDNTVLPLEVVAADDTNTTTEQTSETHDHQVLFEESNEKEQEVELQVDTIDPDPIVSIDPIEITDQHESQQSDQEPQPVEPNDEVEIVTSDSIVHEQSNSTESPTIPCIVETSEPAMEQQVGPDDLTTVQVPADPPALIVTDGSDATQVEKQECQHDLEDKVNDLLDEQEQMVELVQKEDASVTLESHVQPHLELIALDYNLVRECWPLILEQHKSELVTLITAQFSEELKLVKRVHLEYEHIDTPTEIVLEVVESPEEFNDEVIEQPTLTDPTGQVSISILQPELISRRVSFDQMSEDLEWEFDEEPEFERKHVELKRSRNPREDYELGQELGRGKFGTVYRCQERSTGRQLAAKFVHLRRREDRDDVEREVKIMSILQHKRLLQLYDAYDDGNHEMCLITELVEGGELFERIVDDDFELTEKKAAIFMRQICEGVEYMHNQRIVHLDMKPENILCASRSSNRIKLIDFGLARELSDDEPLRVMFGTPDFAAPEVLAYDTVSLATDMWSVGVICYVLLSGLSPFMGDNDMETMANVTRATYDFDDAAFDPISDLAKDFISKLLIREQNNRLKPSECLQHAWLQRGGAQLEASVRSRRESNVSAQGLDMKQLSLLDQNSGANTPPGLVSLDKRNLKKYVVRRKWHKTVHAIMALGRMGANLKLKMTI